ncbi:unnamed protein product [Prunus armeniaca]
MVWVRLRKRMVVVRSERIGCYSHDKRRGELGGGVVDLVRCWWSSCGYGWLSGYGGGWVTGRQGVSAGVEIKTRGE